jgi:hypothetical protein
MKKVSVSILTDVETAFEMYKVDASDALKFVNQTLRKYDAADRKLFVMMFNQRVDEVNSNPDEGISHRIIR